MTSLYVQHGTELEERRGTWSAPTWDPHGLAYLHVSRAFRGTGIGRRLSDELDLIARDTGATEIVVSATPSKNTVHFYLRCGCELMTEALPELYELEPEDVHLRKML